MFLRRRTISTDTMPTHRLVFYVHTKSKRDGSISSLEDSVKDISAMPFDKVGRDVARERRIYGPHEQRSSFEKATKSQQKQQEKIDGMKRSFCNEGDELRLW
mmetsp:Transcript_35430/g.63836  ORF Transcript_35430/g.63836 Transcript_35430/m.63836 type:complete len:102 (+) Transcript_35430:2-307(+)